MTTIPGLLVDLSPGKPRLLVGPRGSGIFEIARAALTALHGRFSWVNCSVVTKEDLVGTWIPDDGGGMVRTGGLFSTAPDGIILDDLDRVEDRDVVGVLRHFLAMTSRTVVGLAHDMSRVPPDLLPLFGQVDERGPVTRAEFEAWAKGG
jgi:hypothetical protein